MKPKAIKFGAFANLIVTLLWAANVRIASASDAELLQLGQKIYAASCADCHGDQGQGVDGAYADPLIGDESVGQLAERIAATMPEGEPEKCIGPDAEAVAAYIHHHFYSEAAQVRNRPPRIGLARLTAEQLRQSLADLYEQFERPAESLVPGGVTGVYFQGSRWKNENKKIERIDPVIDFDFAHDGPGGEIPAEEFYIHWEGGVRVDTTGRYEIVVRSTCSFKMDFGRIDRQLIDNHTQSGDRTEFRQTLMLTAGRCYPFKIDFVQRKRKTEQPPAKITLAWVPPGGVEQVIPPQNLVQQTVPPTFSLQTTLPPDDRSYGFERGIAINREWDESTTAAALEFGQIATQELWPAYLRRQRPGSEASREKMQAFLQQIVSTAFRQDLESDLVETYITKQLAAEADDAQAIQRALLIALKSPRFLYPYADGDQSESQRVATRLCLILYDSLPTDSELRKAIERNEFQSEQQVRDYVQDHLDDPRLHAKTRSMLSEWLNVGQFSEIAKDSTRFPGFDTALVSDLRRSLEMTLDDLVWKGPGDFRQAFTGSVAYTTPRMAAFYGEDWQPAEALADQLGLHSEPLVRATESPQLPRYGLLTHPYLMSGLAYHDASSPIHRGVFLIRYLLGRTLRPPSDAFSPLSPDLHPELTTRERVDLQTSPESCQVCHRKINGLGFTLENYDAAGRYRDLERDKPIDASGEYVSRDDQLASFADIGDLANYLATSPDAQRALVSRAFQHFVKQPPAAFGEHTVDQLTEKFAAADFNVRQLIVEIAVLAARNPIE
jgi:mono/diheme cytochrome c family protein